MKKVAFVLWSLLLPFTVNAQVNVLNLDPKPKPAAIEKYDSLSNICYSNFEQLVGQTIFINGREGASRSSKKCLYDTPNPQPGVLGDEVNYNTYYHHYFYVKSKTSNYLELVDTTSNKTLYLFRKYTDDCYDKFLVVGYYEKMKKMFIGKTFYCTDDYSHFQTVDGDRINNIQFKVPFKCIDVYASPSPFSAAELGNYFYLKAIVESSKYGKLIVNIMYRNPKINTISGFISVNEFNKLVRKYGQVNGRKVAEHRVDIGMTKSMVRDAWGAPERINETSSRSGSEQWIYGNHYIYFRNGRVVDMQRF